MSLENNIKRIADALEALVAQSESAVISGGEAVEKVTAPAPAPVKRASPAVAPAPKTAPVAATATEVNVAAPLAPVLLSDEEMNNALVAEFKRLGNREAIDAAMANLGVTSVVGMTAEAQNALLIAVRAFES